ncbi:MAG: nuclease-related domain-containing protein [Mariprofundaceae bacterium]
MPDFLSSPDALIPLILIGTAMLLLMITVWLSWPWMAASFGAASMRRQLQEFERQGALMLHDIILPAREGKTVYINHLIISRSGIMIVNTVTHLGKISGSRHDATWVSESLQGGVTRFPNPARYTSMAVEAVRGFLGGKFKINDAIVCTGAKLQGEVPTNVLQTKQLHSYISQGEKTLSDKKMHWISNTLKSLAIKDRECYRMYEDIFIEKHSANSYLRTAKIMMAASVGLILIAMTMVGLHLATRQ